MSNSTAGTATWMSDASADRVSSGGSQGGRGATDIFLSSAPDHQSAEPPFKPNTELGQFRIEKHVGRGSLGHVYLATDTLAGHEVAIKVVTVGPGELELAQVQLKREKAACNTSAFCN